MAFKRLHSNDLIQTRYILSKVHSCLNTPHEYITVVLKKLKKNTPQYCSKWAVTDENNGATLFKIYLFRRFNVMKNYRFLSMIFM